MKSNEWISISLCVSKIDKEKMITTGKDGKKYIQLQISVSQERKFKNNASIAFYEKDPKTLHYLGNGQLKAWINGQIVDIEVLPEAADESKSQQELLKPRPEFGKPIEEDAVILPNEKDDDLPF